MILSKTIVLYKIMNNFIIIYYFLISFKLNEGDKIFIPKNTYHRIIKGQGDLVVNIKEK